MIVRTPGREKPVFAPGRPPVRAEHLQQHAREHDEAVFTAFASLNPDQPPFGVDVTDFNRHRFGDPKARSAATHQGGPVLQAGNVREEGLRFFRAEDHGQRTAGSHPGKTLLALRHFHGEQKKDLHGGRERADADTAGLLQDTAFPGWC